MSQLQSMRASQQAADKGGSIHRDFIRWLGRMMNAVNFGIVPPFGIVMHHLSAQEVSDNFDTDGLGKTPGPYDGWQICNGSNGSPDLTGKFPRASVTGSGGTGGTDSSSHTHPVVHDHPSTATAGHTHSVVHDHPSATTGSPSATTSLSGSGTDVASDAHTHAIDIPEITVTSASSTDTLDLPEITVTSGAASSTENMPAYFELVPLMRTEFE